MSLSVFWDNSNIWLVGRNVCHQRETGDEPAFRIHFPNCWTSLWRDARSTTHSSAGPFRRQVTPSGSVLKTSVSKWKSRSVARAPGERWLSMKYFSFRWPTESLTSCRPGGMVLLTGDGSGYTDGKVSSRHSNVRTNMVGALKL